MGRVPNGCVYPDCFNCPLDDCRADFSGNTVEKNSDYYQRNRERLIEANKEYYRTHKAELYAKERLRMQSEEAKQRRREYMREYKRRKKMEITNGKKT